MKGYYRDIKTPQDALYEAVCAIDNQDVPAEEWPNNLIEALDRAGYVVVPKVLPDSVLGEAAIAGVFETGNPKHGWDYLLLRVSASKEAQP